MDMKDIFKSACSVFLVVTTGICAALGLLGDTFAPGMRFGFGTFRQVLILALISAVLTIVFYSSKMLSTRSMVMRVIFHFIIIFFSMFGLIGLHFRWIDVTGGGALMLSLLILGIYVIAMLSSVMGQYIRAVIDADKLNVHVRRTLRLRGKTEQVSTRAGVHDIKMSGHSSRLITDEDDFDEAEDRES